jgi:hypothetical protein
MLRYVTNYTASLTVSGLPRHNFLMALTFKIGNLREFFLGDVTRGSFSTQIFAETL